MNKQDIKDFFADMWEYVRFWWYVPRHCRLMCDMCGICRTGKNYKCGRHGCLLLYWKERDERERKEKEKEG